MGPNNPPLANWTPPTPEVATRLKEERAGLKERNDQIITDKATLSGDIRALEGMFLIFLFFLFSCKTDSLLLARTHRRQQQDPLAEFYSFFVQIWSSNRTGDWKHNSGLSSAEQAVLMNKFGYAPGPDKKHIYTKDDKKE